MSTFRYEGVTLQWKDQHNDKCDGCYLWEHDLKCTVKGVPACTTGIFVEVDSSKDAQE